MYNSDENTASLAQRTAIVLDRAEGFYLRVLRAVILVIATLLLVYAMWLAISSAYKISRSPDSVVEEVASVSADDLAEAPVEASAQSQDAKTAVAATNSVHRRFYSDFVRRYYSLYRSRFEPYRQSEDKRLSQAEFDGAFLNTQARQESIKSGELDFDADRGDLEKLLTVITEAASKPATVARLTKYQAARKIAVKEQVERTRTSYVSGWDSSSMDCPNWYESPIGCAVRRAVETPYMETVTKMQYPAGTQSHLQTFRAFQDRFFELLEARRADNAATAEAKRQDILAGNGEGQLTLMITLQILGAFLVLMFFFLLIAIERHQRKLASSTNPESESDRGPVAA